MWRNWTSWQILSACSQEIQAQYKLCDTAKQCLYDRTLKSQYLVSQNLIYLFTFVVCPVVVNKPVIATHTVFRLLITQVE